MDALQYTLGWALQLAPSILRPTLRNATSAGRLEKPGLPITETWLAGMVPAMRRLVELMAPTFQNKSM